MPFDAAAEVNESTIQSAAERLGASLREARRSKQFSQQALAAAAHIDLATVRGLERGTGTVGPLLAALGVLEHRLVEQPSAIELGDWLAATRKAAGYSQADAAALIGLSKPTVIQVEHGRGNVRSLLAMLRLLRLDAEVVPQADRLHGARLILGDCLEVMPSLPDRSVQAIIADLPYSMTALEWDRPIPLNPLWEQFRRLLTPKGVVILHATQPFTAELVMSNREWFKYALVWEKSRATGFLQADKRHLKKHEDILVFSPGTVVSGKGHQTARNMTYNPQGIVEIERPGRGRRDGTDGDVSHVSRNTLSPVYRPCITKPNVKRDGDLCMFNGRPIHGQGRSQTHTNYPTSILRFASEAKPVHPTQKPLDLARYLVRTFTNEGDTVLDCCFGSGTTGVAALLEGRQFIGIEKNEAYFETAKKRLMQVAPPLASPSNEPLHGRGRNV